MKKALLFLFLATLASFPTLQAQTCSGFFPFEPDTRFEITYYNKKDKVTSISEHEVNDITTVDGVTYAEMKAVTKDKKGKVISDTEYDVECSDETYRLDLTAMLNQQLMESMQNMEIEMNSNALEFPSNITVGQELPGGDTEIKVSSSGMKIMTMVFTISNRKVETQESVTTSAGTFDCYKITYDFEMKTIMKKKYKIVQWISKDVGMVRSETYSKKGKLKSYEVLTKLTKG